METIQFSSARVFRDWLNYDEAQCFGWIDRQKKSHDGFSLLQTAKKPESLSRGEKFHE